MLVTAIQHESAISIHISALSLASLRPPPSHPSSSSQDLYAENRKTLMKKSKTTQTDGETYHVFGLEESILSK